MDEPMEIETNHVNGVDSHNDVTNAKPKVNSMPEAPTVDLEAKKVMEKLADDKKEDGNNFYRQKNYSGALKLYTEAIDLCPDCAAYYTNRAAAYVMLEQYEKALEDCRRALRIDPHCTKASLREAKCHLAMGEPAAANMSYEIVLRREPDNKVARAELDQARQLQEHIERVHNYIAAEDARHAIYYLDRCIEISPVCRKFRVQKAECLVYLRRYQESQEIVNDVLRMDGMNADAVYVRGLCLYYQDQLDKAHQHFQQVLRLAPDHAKARSIFKQSKALVQKKEEGNAAFKANKLDVALVLYTEALAIDKNNVLVNSKIYCNRALVHSKLHKLKEAIDDCTRAIELDEGYVKAYQRRAKCYMDSEMYEEAVRDYEKVCQLDSNRENKQVLREAKLELKKSKRKDYYKILDVSKTANEDEIKKAYRKRALIHHPDRHAHATDEVKKEEERKFKEVGEAYSVLSDPKKRSRYDNGQDLDDGVDMSGFGGDIDPNQIFQAFFGGGAPGGYGFSHGGGGFPSSGFPGGFSFSYG